MKITIEATPQEIADLLQTIVSSEEQSNITKGVIGSSNVMVENLIKEGNTIEEKTIFERLENSLIAFVERASKQEASIEEVRALSAVAASLVSLLTQKL